jgi:hypothetical protein
LPPNNDINTAITATTTYDDDGGGGDDDDDCDDCDDVDDDNRACLDHASPAALVGEGERAETLVVLGQCYAELNEDRLAIAAFEAALQLDPYVRACSLRACPCRACPCRACLCVPCPLRACRCVRACVRACMRAPRARLFGVRLRAAAAMGPSLALRCLACSPPAASSFGGPTSLPPVPPPIPPPFFVRGVCVRVQVDRACLKASACYVNDGRVGDAAEVLKLWLRQDPRFMGIECVRGRCQRTQQQQHHHQHHHRRQQE